eukprot:CAMPEP_0113531770 /NCGR_PEP_ID=MMETSP0015_2-20120614/3679_1 /TAXON_ID=2838 /ORGANISM="Odontella" /LENGTH=232 /DNA_ID=CAMNT_0000430639 /DNA_START=267 /DNA_END=965 /DNA_ORIENTATION=- /assembly_acc=CAM_ASM_000160
MLSLSRSQLDLLSTLSASYTDGLATSDASRRRSDSGGVLNVVLPPINCPKWVCCLLPCIKSIPSMKLFRQIEPEDAEVMRDGRWVRYDAASLVRGDIVRLSDGDAVPADCVVLSLGMDHAATGGDGGEEEEDLEVDHQSITGCPKPSTSSPETSEDGAKSSAQSTRLYYGGRVLRGSCIAVVTAIGPSTALAKLIRDGRWPPKGDLSGEIEAERTEGEDDDEANISLIDRAA